MIQVWEMPRNYLRPVNSIKHVIDSEGVTTGGANSTTPIASAVVVQSAPFAPVEVVVGSYVRSFFLSIYIIGATGAGMVGTSNWFIAKSRSGQSSGSFPGAGQTGTSDLRNQIFHEEKGVPGSIDGAPMVFRGVVKVPRIYQRMREGDEFFIRIRTSDGTNDGQFCIKAIYKSYK